MDHHYGTVVQSPSSSTSSQKITPYVYILTFASALGGLLFGYDTAIVSGAILFIQPEMNLTTSQTEWIVSGVTMGGAVGGITAGTLSDTFGRKPVIMLAATVFLIGAVVKSLSTGFYSLFIGRLIVGFAVGLSSMACNVYIAEVSPREHRGKLVSMNVLFITGGQCVAYIVASFLASVTHGWRWMFGLSGIPALLQLIVMFALPETPRYLVKSDRVEKAEATFRKMRGPLVSDEEISAEIKEIQHSLTNTRQVSYLELFQPRYRRQMIVGAGLQALQQLCGINTVMYYSGIILMKAGFSSSQSAITFAILIAFANACFTGVSLITIDRFGRRQLLLSTLSGLSLGLFCLGLAFKVSFNTGWLALLSLILYVAFFATGIGCVPWTIISEIFPLSIRGAATGVATASNWVCNLVVSITFLSLLEYLGPTWTFWLYSLTGIGTSVFVYFLLPETKGKSLEEIQSLFCNEGTINDKIEMT